MLTHAAPAQSEQEPLCSTCDDFWKVDESGLCARCREAAATPDEGFETNARFQGLGQ
jgi:hypothetical protein